MKKLIPTTFILLIFFLVGCNNLQENKKDINKQQESKNIKLEQIDKPTDKTIQETDSQTNEISIINEKYIKPKLIKINTECFKFEYIENIGRKVSIVCDNVGEIMLSSSRKAILKAKENEKVLSEQDPKFDLYLEFYENNIKLNIPPYFFSSFADANLSWFNLYISYLDKNNIYISNAGWHEAYQSHYFFDGKKWNKFSPWDLIKEVFPDNIQPPFSILISKNYIKIIEENYCCDTVYDYNNPKRKKFREIFIIDREKFNILKREQIER